MHDFPNEIVPNNLSAVPNRADGGQRAATVAIEWFDIRQYNAALHHTEIALAPAKAEIFESVVDARQIFLVTANEV